MCLSISCTNGLATEHRLAKRTISVLLQANGVRLRGQGVSEQETGEAARSSRTAEDVGVFEPESLRHPRVREMVADPQLVCDLHRAQRAQRRCLLIHAKRLSTTQMRGRTWKPVAPGMRLMICIVRVRTSFAQMSNRPR